MARTVDPVVEAQRWLLTTLTADAAVTASAVGTRIGSAPANRSWSYPFLVYQHLPRGKDLRVVNGVVLLHDLTFLVKAVGTDFDRLVLEPTTVAVFNALHNTFGVTANAQIVACTHERPISYPEFTESQQFVHLGAEYRILVKPND